MNIVHKLHQELRAQALAGRPELPEPTEEGRQIARLYAHTENALAVLSDMQTNTSYIYHSGLSEKLGLGKSGHCETVYSIWEEEIFKRIHPDDLEKKHAGELRFFHFLKNISPARRSDYYLISHLRMSDLSGRYVPVRHRLFYPTASARGSIRLALCLYHFSPDASTPDIIFDSARGETFEPEQHSCADLLSKREKEVLRLIDTGKMSKEIAPILSVSVNTINRHRQNILQKLRVQNSIEACRVANELGLID